MNQKNQSNNNQENSKKAKKPSLILVISGILGIFCLLAIIFFLPRTNYQNKQSSSQKKATNEKQDIYSYNEKNLITSKYNYEQADNYNLSAGLKFEDFQPVVSKEIKENWTENRKELNKLFLGGKLS